MIKTRKTVSREKNWADRQNEAEIPGEDASREEQNVGGKRRERQKNRERLTEKDRKRKRDTHADRKR